MAATSSSRQTTLLEALQNDYPDIRFQPGTTFVWSPLDMMVTYDADAMDSVSSAWSLLHETAHAILGHQRYRSDIELVQLEAEAWHMAENISEDYKVEIPADHIDDCMDSYRDWLHARSRCPVCTQVGLQSHRRTYTWINCYQSWRVTDQKFKRPYRLCIPANGKKSP